MNGPHDLGGRMDFGPILPQDEEREQLFHEPWEARALGITLCCNALGLWKLDDGRYARECLPPGTYLSSSYYQIWIYALENLLMRYGELSPEELSRGHMIKTGIASDRMLLAENVAAVLEKGGPTARPNDRVAKFAVGDRVHTKNMHPKGHTRLPGYARDKTGTVTARHGSHAFPDAIARSAGEQPQWLYTVEFDATVLWGADAEPNSVMSIEAWEPYLEPA